MSETKFSPNSEQNVVVRWLQIITGVVILLGAATIVYAILLMVSGLIPFFDERFPYGFGEFFRVGASAAAGMWAGATTLKFFFPRVGRRAVFVILAILLVLAIIGGAAAMTTRGTREGWEAILSSIVFVAMGAYLLRGNGWDELPSRKDS